MTVKIICDKHGETTDETGIGGCPDCMAEWASNVKIDGAFESTDELSDRDKAYLDIVGKLLGGDLTHFGYIDDTDGDNAITQSFDIAGKVMAEFDRRKEKRDD